MPKVIHFDLPATEPERAMKFYNSVFGWEFIKAEVPWDYWLIKAGPDDEPGINGGMGKVEEGKLSKIDAISVPDLDKYMKLVEENNGKLISIKMVIPGTGYLATFQDTEGNIFHMLENDPTAGL